MLKLFIVLIKHITNLKTIISSTLKIFLKKLQKFVNTIIYIHYNYTKTIQFN